MIYQNEFDKNGSVLKPQCTCTCMCA